MKKIFPLILLFFILSVKSFAGWESFGPANYWNFVYYCNNTLWAHSYYSIVPYDKINNHWNNKYIYVDLGFGFDGVVADEKKNNFYAWQYRNVYITCDTGKTWKKMNKNIEVDAGLYQKRDLEIQNLWVVNDTIYATSGTSGFIFSPKDSISWNFVDYNYSNYGYNHFPELPSPYSFLRNSDTIILGDLFKGLFVSFDNGRNFIHKENLLDTCAYRICKLDDKNFVFTPKSVYEISNTGDVVGKVMPGLTHHWSKMFYAKNKYFYAYNIPFEDSTYLAISKDKGVTWDSIKVEIADEPMLGRFCNMTTDGDYIYVGTQNAVLRTPIEEIKWELFTKYLNTGVSGGIQNLNKGINRYSENSYDHGETWISNSVCNGPITLDSINKQIFWYKDSLIYLSKDDCLTGSEINSDIKNRGIISSMFIFKDTLFVVDIKSQIFKTSCKKIKWESINSNLPESYYASNFFVFKNQLYLGINYKGILSYNPNFKDGFGEYVLSDKKIDFTKYVVTDSLVYGVGYDYTLSTEDLKKWTSINFLRGGTDISCNSIADLLVVSSKTGLFVSYDYGKYWENLSSQLPSTHLTQNGCDDEYIYVGSFAAGLLREKLTELFKAPYLISPINSAEVDFKSVLLHWKYAPIVKTDIVQVSEDTTFANVVYSRESKGGRVVLPELKADKKYYWRVKSVYKNNIEKISAINSFKTSIISSIKNNEDNFVSISPNPAKEFINVRLNINSEDSISLIIYDLSGKEVKRLNSLSPKSVNNINISDLTSGAYTALIKIGKEEIVRKIIVE